MLSFSPCSENTVLKTRDHFLKCRLRHGRLQADEGAAGELRAGGSLRPQRDGTEPHRVRGTGEKINPQQSRYIG